MEPYTYMWDKVIAEDFFAQFVVDNPLAGDAPPAISPSGARTRRIDACP